MKVTTNQISRVMAHLGAQNRGRKKTMTKAAMDQRRHAAKQSVKARALTRKAIMTNQNAKQNSV